MLTLLRIFVLLYGLAVIIIPTRRMLVQDRRISELYTINQGLYNMADERRAKYKPIAITLILTMLLIFWISIIVANKYDNIWPLTIGACINSLHFWITRSILDQISQAITIVSSVRIEITDDDDDSNDGKHTILTRLEK